MHVLLNLMQKKLYMRLVKSFWYYVAIDIVPLSVTGTGFQTLLANQKKILSHHCIHRRGGLLFYTTRHFGFTQKLRRKYLVKHAIHTSIWLCIHAGIKETLVRCFSIESENHYNSQGGILHWLWSCTPCVIKNLCYEVPT